METGKIAGFFKVFFTVKMQTRVGANKPFC